VSQGETSAVEVRSVTKGIRSRYSTAQPPDGMPRKPGRLRYDTHARTGSLDRPTSLRSNSTKKTSPHIKSVDY
jgi:hypothetical protein